jgi:hypothetical protein
VQCKQISFPGPYFGQAFPVAKVLSVKCRSAAAGNEFGGLVSGELRLQAPIIEARCAWREVEYFWQGQRISMSQGIPVLHATGDWGAKRISLDFDIPSGDYSYLAEGELIYLVPLYGRNGASFGRQVAYGSMGMLVLKCVNESARVFERFGYLLDDWDCISVTEAVITIV